MLDKLKMEFLGSFMIFLIIGMSFVNFTYGAIDTVSILFNTFAVTASAYWISRHLCDCHFNPALTLAHMATRHTHPLTGLCFISAQLLAGVFAASIIKISIPIDLYQKVQDSSILGFKSDFTNVGLIFAIEAIGTLIFVFAFYLLKYQRNIHHAVFAPGVAALFSVLVFFSYNKTGSVFNPARIFGISFVAKDYFQNLWCFLLAPIVGGIVGGIIGNFLLLESPQEITQRKLKDINRRKTLKMKQQIDENLRQALQDDEVEENQFFNNLLYFLVISMFQRQKGFLLVEFLKKVKIFCSFRLCKMSPRLIDLFRSFLNSQR